MKPDPDYDGIDRTDPEQLWIHEIADVRDFTVTSDHLKLLRRAHVFYRGDWDDNGWYGAPCISPHRPYGNSDVLDDVADIIGADRDDEYREGGRPDPRERFARLHAETALALQICLAMGEFEPGRFVRGRYPGMWLRAAESSRSADKQAAALHLMEHGVDLSQGDIDGIQLWQLAALDPCGPQSRPARVRALAGPVCEDMPPKDIRKLCPHTSCWEVMSTEAVPDPRGRRQGRRRTEGRRGQITREVAEHPNLEAGC